MPWKDFSDNRKLEKLWENTLQVSISELGKSPGGGNDNPLQYSRLETSMRTWLSDWTELNWWAEQPGRLQSVEPLSWTRLSIQFSSVAQSCPTLCDPIDCSTAGLPVHHHSWSLFTFMSIVSVTPSNHLILCCLSPSPPAFNLSQHQGLFWWVCSSHQVAKVLELQHLSFQWIFRVDFL